MRKKLNQFIEAYKKGFCIEEIEKDRVLQWTFGAFIFGLFLNFNTWVGNGRFTKEAVDDFGHVCWPYAQNCEVFGFLSALPYGYTQNMWFMGLFGLLALAVYFMYQKKWHYAQMIVLICLLWKALITFTSMWHTGNYEYYLIVFGLILLCFPHKLFFLKFSLVLFYFLSTAAKINDSWILGSYFTALKTGLPIFPDSTIPFWTNLVILMEMIFAWFLLGPNTKFRKLIFLFFVAFHLYSGILVGFRYPATVMPMLLILFGPWYKHTLPPTGLKTLPGWILVGLLCLGQAWSHFIPGDERLTLEGNFYGLYMFEANHQCFSTRTIYYKDETEPQKGQRVSFTSRGRCDPYRYWFRFNKQCEKETNIKRIEWTFDHSINGHPFYRIVDTPNICDLEYKPFTKNNWIKTPDTGAEVVGYPGKNYYY